MRMSTGDATRQPSARKPGQAARVRHALTAPGVILTILLVGGILALVTHSNAVASADARRNAEARAEMTADDLDRTFAVWRTELLVAAADPALTDWYRRPEDRERLRPLVDQALMTLNRIEPALIDEACLIDADGREWARQVKGTVGRPHEMSHDESGNPFFAITLDLPVGQVRHNPPYLSPDTHRWVISNSTPLVVDDRTVGMVHFEANLEVIHDQLMQAAGPDRIIAVVDPTTGDMIADSRSTEPLVAQPLMPALGRSLPESWGTATVQLHGAEGIASRWQVIVAVAPTRSWDAGLILRITTLLMIGAVAGALLRLTSQLRPQSPTVSSSPAARH